ncbi:MAG: phosphate ABC transporter substrate-binding protein PstS [Elusimicrobia bacterium RBG_16_66_12]|nr:MAG: phosphate ABC transporter substrate-binding protein PstS [Elusimicrobia bacterium RBG_16_66_12]
MNLELKTIVVLALAAAPAAAQVKGLTGAGATFPYPIYSKWFDEYHKVKPELQINYQSIGSGGGIRQVTEKTVDFGATDGPMTTQQQFKVDGRILHVPTVLGAVVPAYNLKGVEDLKLSGPILADVYLGKITRWTDPAISQLNAAVKLPDAPITVVHRSDGSGTTYCFVDYLSKVSPEWKKKVGVNTAVNWPAGLGGKGNEGVAGLVKQTPNALGYVELIYAKQNDIAYASMLNKSGKFVKASIESVTAAAAGVAMPKDYRVSITDAAGEGAYPISTFTWLLVYEKNDEGKGAVLKDFLRWMLKDGQGMASALGYAPLPASVNAMVAKSIEAIK